MEGTEFHFIVMEGRIFLFDQKIALEKEVWCLTHSFSPTVHVPSCWGQDKSKQERGWGNSPICKPYFYLREPLVVADISVKHLRAHMVLRK